MAGWNASTDERAHEPVLGDTPVDQAHVRDWADGLRLPIGGESILFVDCEAAFYRTSVPRAVAQILARRLRVRVDGRAVVLRRPGGRDGLHRPGPPVRRAQPRRLAETPVPARVLVLDPHDYISFTEDSPRYFGADFDLEVVLVVELFAEMVRDGR